MTPYCVWTWKLPTYVKFDEKFEDEDDEPIDDTKTKYNDKMSTVQTSRTGLSSQTRSSKAEQRNMKAAQQEDNDYSKRTYSITAMKLHTSDFQHYQEDFNKNLSPQATPILFKVHENSGYIVVSFSDGDLVVYNCFCNKIMFKYLINGRNRVQRYIVDFEILSESDYDANQQAAYKQNGTNFSYLPLIALYSDSQVATLNSSGYETIICSKGLNNANVIITKIKLVHGSYQFSEWDKFKKTTSSMKDDALINAMLLNSIKDCSPRQWLLCVGEKGILQVVPMPTIQKEYPQQFWYHRSSIQFIDILRENSIITVSSDNQIVISQLRFGQLSSSKPVPKAALFESQVIRSKQLQESLDLLLFEILNKSFLMKQESEVSIKKLQIESETQIYKMYNDYQSLKNQVINQLNDEHQQLQTVENEFQLKKASQEQKAKVLADELNHSYTEQLNVLKQENDKLNREYVETKLQSEQQLNNYNAETDRLVQEYHNQTNIKLQEMEEVIQGLLKDKQQLEMLSEAQIRKATDELEQEITILYKQASDAEKQETSTVVGLRQQHKQMEGSLISLQKEFQQLKDQLNTKKSQVSLCSKELQYKQDQLAQINNEIQEKTNIEKAKNQTIIQMHEEKDDLLKLKQLLTQRVTDLKKQVAPRDDMIADLQTQVQDMDQELFKDALKQKNADMLILENKQKKQSLQNSIAQKQASIYETEQSIKELLTDLQNFCHKYLAHIGIKPQNLQKQIGNIQTPISLDQAHKEFATALKVIYSKHVDKDLAAQLQGRLMGTNVADDENNVEHKKIQKINQILGTNKIKLISKSSSQSETPSIAKQREYLEKSVVTLEKSLARRREQLNQAIEKARQQSSSLLSFSNLMRRENKTLQQKLRAAKLELIKKKQEMGILQEQLFGPALEALLEQEDQPDIQQDDQPATQLANPIVDEFKNANMDKYLEENFPLPQVQGAEQYTLSTNQQQPNLPKIPKK